MKLTEEEKRKIDIIDKKRWYLIQLTKLLQVYRHYGFDKKELLLYIARQLGFEVKKVGEEDG